MLRNRRIREQAGLSNFCYADGKRSSASDLSRIDVQLDSGIRAVAIDHDVSYAEARQFIELETPPAAIKDTGARLVLRATVVLHYGIDWS